MSCGCGGTNSSNSNFYNPLTNPAYPCGDNSPCSGCGGNSDPCGDPLDCDPGCKIELDTNCVRFGTHGEQEDLQGIGSYVGDTLTDVLKRIDSKLSSVNPLSLEGIDFGYLGTKYDIQSFADFAESVVQELTTLKENKSIGTAIPTNNYTVRNIGTSVGYYKVRDKNGVLSGNVQIAGKTAFVIANAQGVSSISPDVIVMNNGSL